MSKILAYGAIGATVLIAAGLVAGDPRASSAQEASAAAASQAVPASPGRAEIETIVREYLLANPELLLEIQQALETKQQAEQSVAQREIIEQAEGEIFNAEYDGVVGNPEGKVTIVEFYDYNCGYCKRAQEDMQLLTAADPELRFVLKEFPILGPDSQKAHVVSMAFRAMSPEKYGDFHRRLLMAEGKAGEATALKIAVELGVDETRLREEMKNPAINEAFAKTYDLANKLSITGTPSYVVGREVIFGAMGPEVLGEKIAAAKACLDNAC